MRLLNSLPNFHLLKGLNSSFLLLLLIGCSSSPYLEYWPNGQVKEKRMYAPEEDGDEGKYAVWRYSEAGVLLAEGQMLLGERHGKWEAFYENGTPKLIATYREGVPIGPFAEYHKSGKMKSSCFYSEIGELDSAYQVWDETGRPLIAGTYDNGVPIGTWQDITYTAGSLTKEEVDYTANGLAVMERTYDDPSDRTFFKFTARNRFGFLDSIGEMRRGHRDGNWVFYEEQEDELPSSGTFIRSSGTFVNGLKHGFWQEWTGDSVLVAEGEFAAGEKIDIWFYYYQGGTIQQNIEHTLSGTKINSHIEGDVQTLYNGNGYIDTIIRRNDDSFIYGTRYRSHYKNGQRQRISKKVLIKYRDQ